jgi:hypothetical protein
VQFVAVSNEKSLEANLRKILPQSSMKDKRPKIVVDGQFYGLWRLKPLTQQSSSVD